MVTPVPSNVSQQNWLGGIKDNGNIFKKANKQKNKLNSLNATNIIQVKVSNHVNDIVSQSPWQQGVSDITHRNTIN